MATVDAFLGSWKDIGSVISQVGVQRYAVSPQYYSSLSQHHRVKHVTPKYTPRIATPVDPSTPSYILAARFASRKYRPASTIQHHREKVGSMFGHDFTTEAFLGNAYNMPGFQKAEITPDVDTLKSHALVRGLDKAIATGDVTTAANTLSRTVMLIANRLPKFLTAEMNDGNTQLIVDWVTIINILIEKMQAAFPEGVPEDVVRLVDETVADVNSYVQQLIKRRTMQFAQSKAKFAPPSSGIAHHTRKHLAPGETSRLPLNIAPALAIRHPDYDVPVYMPQPHMVLPEAAAQAEARAVPGGGAAGRAGEVIDENGVVQKTAMQRFGPALALAGGALAAYFAFR